MLRMSEIETPIGTLYVTLDGSDKVKAIGFARPDLEPVVSKAGQALQRYFAGDFAALAEVEVDPDGTPFQKSVWKSLREIPLGETTTYGELAAKLGSHARAIGSANGANPVAVVVPCHRVIGKSGALTGYAWGLERKKWLLEHERTR
jgi:methylated-DNA-[protein]-cysteine S-methyltransferase